MTCWSCWHASLWVKHSVQSKLPAPPAPPWPIQKQLCPPHQWRDCRRCRQSVAVWSGRSSALSQQWHVVTPNQKSLERRGPVNRNVCWIWDSEDSGHSLHSFRKLPELTITCNYNAGTWKLPSNEKTGSPCQPFGYILITKAPCSSSCGIGPGRVQRLMENCWKCPRLLTLHIVALTKDLPSQGTAKSSQAALVAVSHPA